MNFLEKNINALNKAVGELFSWFTLFMVIITALVVLLRYGFNIGFIWMQESVRFMYAAVFLICAGYISSGKPFSEQLYMDIKEKLDE